MKVNIIKLMKRFSIVLEINHIFKNINYSINNNNNVMEHKIFLYFINNN